MAEHQKRGWVWTENENFPKGLQELKRRSESARIQLERLVQALPECATEAKIRGDAFIKTANPLVHLWNARKNKFFPLSPEEASAVLKEVRSAEEEWLTFLRRGDVQKRIGEVNRGVHAEQRQYRNMLAEARSKHMAQLETHEFRKQFHETMMKSFDVALVTVDLSMKLYGFGNETHRPILRRLVIVHFVRFTYEGLKRRAETLRAFLRLKPAPSIYELATEAAINVVRDSIASFDPRHPPLFGNPIEIINSLIAAAADGFMQSVQSWGKEGKTPEQIGRGYFTILGFDYSIEAHPE